MAFSDHVKVLFGMDSDGFHNGLQKADKATKKFGGNFKKYFVGALGTAVIAKTTKSVIDFGASIGDMSTRLGASSKFLQGLQYGAEQSGVKADSATIAFQRFTRRTSEAKDKAGPLRDTLEKLGIQFTTSGGVAKTSEQLFNEFGQALADMEDPAEKVRTAFQFLDTEGVGLTQMFQKGAKSVSDYTAEAERLGLIMSDDTIKSLQKADGTLNQLGRQFKVMVAQFLPPFLDELRKIGAMLVKGMGIIKNYAGEITALATSFGAYFVAVKALQGGALVVKAFRTSMIACQGLTGAVTALNVATKLNPFALIIAGAVALGFGIKALIGKLNENQKQWENWEKNTIAKAKAKSDELVTAIVTMQTELAQLNQELIDMGAIGSMPKTLQETHKGLLISKAHLDSQEKTINRQLKYYQDIVVSQKEHIANLKEKGASEVKIARQLVIQKDLEKGLVDAQIAKAKHTKDMHNTTTALTKTTAELKDIEFARANGLQNLLKDRVQEQVELDRTLARVDALKKGGQDALDVVKKRHAMEDLIVKLMKQNAMPMAEAKKLAQDILNATTQEKLAHEAIKKVQDDKVALKKQEADRKAIIDALQAEANLHAQARGEAQQHLDVLKLRANGQQKEADILAEKLKLQGQIKAIADAQGIAQAGAIQQLEKKFGLEKDILLQKVNQEKQELINKAVGLQANRELRDAVDAKDKKRIRASKQVQRIDERIAELQKQGGKRAQDEIDKLKQVKQRQLDFILDDGTKQNLDQLEKKKIDIADNHDVQMDALQKRLQEIQANELKAQAELDIKKAEIAKAGEDAKLKTINIVEAGKKEIKKVGDAVDKLANKQPVVKAQVQVVMPSYDPQQAIVNSLDKIVSIVATEKTLVDLHKTIKGKFVNQ
jgi:hypothetical protein